MKNMPKPIKYMLLLIILGLITGGLLSFVNGFTAPKIKEYEEEKTNNMLKELCVFETKEVVTTNYQNSKEINDIFALKDKEGNVISIVYKITTKGYGGDVVVLVAIDASNDTFINTKIVSASNETPGLGSKITTYDFGVKEKDVSNTNVVAISGATKSSNAVINAIKIASSNYINNKNSLKGDL